MSGCGPKCWEPVRCPEHGDLMTPFGRSAPLEVWQCCEMYMHPGVNPRHLWNEHDSTRWYSDPAGWTEHERQCAKCGDSEEGDEG